MADYIWNNMRLAGSGFAPGGGSYDTFKYELIGDTSAAADLNLLVAPIYSWLWCRTANATYKTRYDTLFCGGNNPSAYFPSGKQFDQAYMWSFSGQKYRNSVGQADCPSGTVATPTPTPTVTPNPSTIRRCKQLLGVG